MKGRRLNNSKGFWKGFILPLTFLLVCNFAFAFKSKKIDPELGSVEWIRYKIQRYPEISWLADSEVTATNDYSASSSESYSRRIFGKQFVEFDRTFLSLEFFNRILRGSSDDYAWLIQKQAPSNALTRASFNHLHAEFEKLSSEKNHDLTLLEVAIVLSDMGKTAKARKLSPVISKRNPDQDKFYEEAIVSNPEIFPSFARLNLHQKKILQSAPHTLHFGHVAHLEGDQRMFKLLKESGLLGTQEGRDAFKTEFWTHVSDVAGAAGHVTSQGSITLTEPTYKRLLQVYKSALMLATDTSNQALMSYIKWSGDWLGQEVESAIGIAVIRLASMLRLSEKEDVEVLRNALATLSTSDKEVVLRVFSFAFLPESAKTPTYIPAVLSNLSKNEALGKSYHERLLATVQIGSVSVAKAMKHAFHHSIKAKSGEIIVNFNPMAAQAKSEKVAKLFEKGEAFLNENGEISIIEKRP